MKYFTPAFPSHPAELRAASTRAPTDTLSVTYALAFYQARRAGASRFAAIRNGISAQRDERARRLNDRLPADVLAELARCAAAVHVVDHGSI